MDKPTINQRKRRYRLAQSAEDTRRLASFFLGLALLMALVSYWPTLGYGFIYDDNQQIVETRL